MIWFPFDCICRKRLLSEIQLKQLHNGNYRIKETVIVQSNKHIENVSILNIYKEIIYLELALYNYTIFLSKIMCCSWESQFYFISMRSIKKLKAEAFKKRYKKVWKDITRILLNMKSQVSIDCNTSLYIFIVPQRIINTNDSLQ